MNYEESLKNAKKDYEQNLRKIEFNKRIAEKIEPALPEGWNCYLDCIVFSLIFEKGFDSYDERYDPNEFKLVCKLVESAIGEKLTKRAQVKKTTNQIYLLEAQCYYSENEAGSSIFVYLYDPQNPPDCKITWKWTREKKAIVSDSCLGINGD